MMDELPIVTQADRDAAKNAGLHFNDEHIIMQAFALHRIASTPPAISRNDLIERLHDIDQSEGLTYEAAADLFFELCPALAKATQ